MSNQDILKDQGIMRKGYGIIPKIPMQDKRLTAESKGLYAYFRSYAGKGTTAFPSRSKIIDDMQMSKHRYYKCLNLLVQHGYLKVEMTTDANGRFKRNVYTLLEVAEDNLNQNKNKIVQRAAPCPDFSETEEPPKTKEAPETAGSGHVNRAIPCPDFLDTDSPFDSTDTGQPTLDLSGTEPCPDSPCAANQDTNNNINNKNNIGGVKCLSHGHSQVTKITAKKKDADNDDDMKPVHQNKQIQNQTPKGRVHLNPKGGAAPRHSMRDHAVYKQLLHDRIDYWHLVLNNPYDTEFINALVEIMLDTILTEEPKRVNIGKETKSREVVKSVFMKLTSDHIELVMSKFKEQCHTINNKTAYLRTMLYNSYLEIDPHYTNQVRVDYAGKAGEDWP